MHCLAALADPNRRRIVEMLAGRELAVGEIGAAFEISAPAVSQHLKVLKEARIVRSRIEGQRRIYALEPAGFAELERWLAGVRRFWVPRLDELERRMLRHKARPARRPDRQERKRKARRP